MQLAVIVFFRVVLLVLVLGQLMACSQKTLAPSTTAPVTQTPETAPQQIQKPKEIVKEIIEAPAKKSEKQGSRCVLTPQYSITQAVGDTGIFWVAIERLDDLPGPRNILSGKILLFGKEYSTVDSSKAEITSIVKTEAGYKISGTYSLELSGTVKDSAGQAKVVYAKVKNAVLTGLECTEPKTN
jgi:hypothetical protein